MIENNKKDKDLIKITDEYNSIMLLDKNFQEIEREVKKIYKKLDKYYNYFDLKRDFYGKAYYNDGLKTKYLFDSKNQFLCYSDKDKPEDFLNKTLEQVRITKEEYEKRVSNLASILVERLTLKYEYTFAYSMRFDIFDNKYENVTNKEMIYWIKWATINSFYKGLVSESVLENYISLKVPNVISRKSIEMDKNKSIDISWESIDANKKIGCQLKSKSFTDKELSERRKETYYKKNKEALSNNNITKMIYVFHGMNSIELISFIDLETSIEYPIEELPRFINDYLNN